VDRPRPVQQGTRRGVTGILAQGAVSLPAPGGKASMAVAPVWRFATGGITAMARGLIQARLTPTSNE